MPACQVNSDFAEMSATEAILLSNKVRQLFALMDQNGDNKLSKAEFQSTLGQPNLLMLLGKVCSCVFDA